MSSVLNDDGRLQVSGIDGRLVLAVDDGDLIVTGTAGDLTARGDDGDVDLRGVTGAVDARTDDGDVHVSGVLDVVRIRADDGHVDLFAAAGSTLRDDWDIRADDGDLSLVLPADLAADLLARSDDGRIEISPPLGTGDRRARRSNRVSGPLNGGGPALRVTTDDGRISITR